MKEEKKKLETNSWKGLTYVRIYIFFCSTRFRIFVPPRHVIWIVSPVRVRFGACARRVLCSMRARPSTGAAVAPATAAANNPVSGRLSRRRGGGLHAALSTALVPVITDHRAIIVHTRARIHARTNTRTLARTHARRTVARVRRRPPSRQSIDNASTTVVGVVLVLPYYTTSTPFRVDGYHRSGAARSSAHRCRCSPSLS